MTIDYFELAKGITRSHVATADDMPVLNPEEHAFVERAVGRTLTNEEAQIALRAATLYAAFEHWLNTGRKEEA